MSKDLLFDIINASPFGFAFYEIISDSKDPEKALKFLEVNESFRKLVGLQGNEFVQKTVGEVFGKLPESTFNWKEFYANIDFNHPGKSFEQYSQPLDCWFQVQTYSHQKGFLATTFIDIKLRKDAIDALKSSEQKYRSLVSNLPGTTYRCVFDHTWKITFMSPEISTLTGYPAEDFYKPLQKSYDSLIHPADKDFVNQSIEKAIATGQSWELEYRILHKNGQEKWVFEKGVSVSGEGSSRFMDGFILDVTDRKMAEEALRKSEENQRILLDNIQTQVWYLIDDHTYGAVNEAHATFIGMGKDQMSFKSLFDVFPEKASLKLQQENSEVFRTSKPIYSESWIRNAAGEKRLISTAKIPKLNTAGKVEYVVCSADDITEEKAYQGTLELLIQMAKSFINMPVESISIEINKALESMGRFVNADRAYIFEYDWEKMVCNNTFEWCQTGIEPQIEFLQDLPTDAIPWWVEAHMEGKTLSIPNVSKLAEDDGVRQILEPQDIKSLMTIPMMSNGTCNGFIGFDSILEHHYYTEKEEILLAVFSELLVNIHHREHLERALISEKQKADSANKAKSEFLANMSHEIRTPMNAILGFSEALYHKMEKEQHKSMIKSILNGGNLLLSLLNDILDLSKIEAGRIEISAQSVDILSIVEEIKLLFQDNAAKKGIKILIEIGESFPPALKLDEIRIKQILFNLVGNAIKFTHIGSVNIRLYAEMVELETNLIIEIEDTGIGIPADQQESIFEAFRQQSGHASRHFAGAGLGLAISRRLAEKMNGTLTVKSNEGKGSTFTLKLNQVTVCESVMPKRDFYDLKETIIFENNTILIVDDVRANIDAVESLLAGSGLHIITADNGMIALEILKQVKPSLILLDIRMPELSGYEVIRIIKNDHLMKDIPVIAFTASTMGADQDPGRDLFDNYIFKPVSKGELVNILAVYLSHTRIMAEEIIKPASPKLTDVSPEFKQRLQLLGKELRSELIPVWEDIKEGTLLFKIEDFARVLLNISEQYDCNYLAEYAGALLADCTELNLENIKDGLDKFPEIVSTIENQ